MSLTPDEVIALHWMVRCNDDPDPIGFLGPTVKRHGPIPEYARLVALGYARLGRPLTRNADRMGYWITQTGRRALATASGQIRRAG